MKWCDLSCEHASFPRVQAVDGVVVLPHLCGALLRPAGSVGAQERTVFLRKEAGPGPTEEVRRFEGQSSIVNNSSSRTWNFQL